MDRPLGPAHPCSHAQRAEPGWALGGGDVGGADRLALAVLVQYRMATTERLHLLTAPQVRI
ncbi:hypothetical protein [Streptomyces phaeochromogenes]|uniref:hypothetical protein n=1 Tax=Streptomyces phaeochromogenes TaxID=1923 RepID=UPI00386CBA60|nr:hypothetical protein OG277_38320 [Streptomyces phaeochromogenes]